MIRRLSIIWALTAAVLLHTAGFAKAQSASSPIYRLNQQSTYQEGCVPPCTCAVSQVVQVIGTFILTPAPGTVTATYEVSQVNWTLMMGSRQFLVTGSGMYQVAIGTGNERQQRLQLALSIGGQAPLLFDSGWLPVKSNFPEIIIPISNLTGCVKKVFAVDASPAQETDIHPYDLVSGSTFQSGCFPPCRCALGPKQPLGGDFVLVNLPPNPLFQEFAVVNVDWTAAPPPASIPINGAGFYKVGGEVAAQQEMSLELSVDGGPLTHFDSGLVRTGAIFPDINVTVSIHGGRCADTVITIKAEQLK
jgi:hypothetical protein